MKKSLAAATILLMTVLALSGCYPTDKRVNEKENESGIPSGSSENTHFDGSHFGYEGENISVSFDIPEVPDELPSRIKLKEKMFDRQKVIELFFDGEAPVSEYIYGNEEYGQYTAQDGSKLTIEGNRIAYSNGKISTGEGGDARKFPVSYSNAVNACKEYNRDRYSITGDELEGFPLQGALDSAVELISKLGITTCGEPRIYAFSLASYEKMKHDRPSMFNEEYPLTKDNEIYVFKFPQIIDEVELSDIRWVSVKDSVNEFGVPVGSSSIVVGVSKEGIFEFYTHAAYEAEGEVLSTEPIKYDLSHAVAELEKYLDKVYFTKSKTVAINNARVVYYPVERNEADVVEFVPAWSFDGYVRDMEMEAIFEHVQFWDFSFIVNTDVGVVREYSEV